MQYAQEDVHVEGAAEEDIEAMDDGEYGPMLVAKLEVPEDISGGWTRSLTKSFVG